MPGHDIITIGASAGGVEALKKLTRALPADLPAAVFVVLHVGAQSPPLLPSILEKSGVLPVFTAADNMPFKHGCIYVAPADFHMLVERKRLRVVRGPKENRHRPAVDPLFRSAAWAYGPRVVGVVLTGMLDDGTAGLWAVKSCGGVAIVQDPVDAEFPGMPNNALINVQVDHCLPLAKIAPLLDRLAREPVSTTPRAAVPEPIKTETEFTKMAANIEDMSRLGAPSVFTCPSCHGAIWELEDGGLLRFRCHTGHAFSPESLLAEQADGLEDVLYSALRALEEKAVALRRIGERLKQNLPRIHADYQARARAVEKSADLIRKTIATQKT